MICCILIFYSVQEIFFSSSSFFFFFCHMACRIRSLTRDQTLAPCSGSTDSQPPGHQRSSHAFVLHVLLWLFATPCTVAFDMGFPRQESWGGLPFPPPRYFPNPELEPTSPVSSVSPALQVDSLPLSHNFTFIISLYEGDLKLHFYKHFIEASLCRMLTEINFVFSVAFLSNTYLWLTLSWPWVKVHPSLRSDCPSQWPSWPKSLQVSLRLTPSVRPLSGLCPLPPAPGAYLLLETQSSLSLPSLTTAHLPRVSVSPKPQKTWQTGCWPFLKIFSGGDERLLGVVENVPHTDHGP